METNRLKLHIERTLAYTLFDHQYGVVDDVKNTSIVNAMVSYLQGLHDAMIINNFSLSVVNVSEDHISVSIAITQLKGTEPFLIKSDIHTQFESVHESDFDRAMKGV